MIAFRGFLLVAIVAILAYTIPVGLNHGWNFMATALADLAVMDWRGQFDIDFLFLLSLAGIWLAWRHEFSAAGLFLGVFTFFGGMPFLSVYLLYAISKNGGDMRKVLLGERRAAA
ncbi:MAG TPA: hypothetical protein VHL34_08020 [Rhizomicrobium sp.]|jgi:hypothetical protein|nr:hypothetical protein [Rhizomicrobium sp.]